MEKKVYLYKKSRYMAGMDVGYVYNEKSKLVPFRVPDSWVEEKRDIDCATDEIERTFVDDVARSNGLVLVPEDAISGVSKRKELLRIALNKVGFNIPKGKRLDEWIPYVKERGNA